MNTRSLLSSLVLIASFGVATAASAAGTAQVVPAEFGRDGVPSVTVIKGAESTAAHAQAFGRDVPDTRVRSVKAKPALQGDASPFLNRHGHA